MTETTQAVDGQYTYHELTGTAEEARRQERVAEVYDEPSTRILTDLAIQPEWRCLDAGCGNGTVAEWISRRAHNGLTIACDIDAANIKVEPSAVLKPMVCDIADADFEPGSLNVIHARLMLQHIADREQVLDKMVSWLAPGGWLVVADGFDLAASSTTHLEYAEFYRRFWSMLDQVTATSPPWGRGYPEPLIRRGLTDIRYEVVVQPVHGGNPYALMFRQGLEQQRALIVGQGIEEALLDAVIADLADPSFWDLGFALAYAVGRKPLA